MLKQDLSRNIFTNRLDSQPVDRKLDLMVKELNRYSVSVAGVQETKGLAKMCSQQLATHSCILDIHCQATTKKPQEMNVTIQ